MKSKEVKLFLFILFIIISGLMAYEEVKKYPDIETYKSIKKVVNVGDREIYSKSVVSDFNSNVKAFRGNARINIDENKTLQLINSNSDMSSYANNETEDNPNNNNVDEEIDEKNKYYNEEKLELYLILYNYYNDKNLSIEEIKSFVDEGKLENEKEIKEYIDWYYIGNSEKYYLYYVDRFDRITNDDELYNEYNSRYGDAKFNELPLEDRKKIFNEFNELKIIDYYKNNKLKISKNSY